MNSELHSQTAGEATDAKVDDTVAAAASESSPPLHRLKHEGQLRLPPPIAMAAVRPQTQPAKTKARRHTPAAQRRRHAQTERPAGFTASPLGIALLAAWLLTVFAAFSFDVVLDVFQRSLTLRDPPAIPWVLLVCTNAGIHFFLMFLVVLLGRLTKRRFYFFMPFSGGDAFVILQLAGYGCVYVTAAVRAVLLSQKQERYCVYTVLGVFAVVGHSLLLWSISFFQSPPPSNSSTQPSSSSASLTAGMARGWRERLAHSPQREIAWIILCSGVVILSSTAAEYHPAYRSINVMVIICFVFVSLLTIQYIVVPQWLARHFYHVLLPVVLQSPTLYVLQVFGNGLLFMTFYAELVLFNAQRDAPPSWHLGCGLMAVMAIGAHLLLVGQLHAWVVVEDDNVEKKKRAVAAAAAPLSSPVTSPRPPSPALGNGSLTATSFEAQKEGRQEPRSAQTSSSIIYEEYKNEISSYGPMLPSLFSAVLCVVLIGILYVSSISGDRLSAYVRQGLAQLEALLVALLFVQPLITHLMGVFLYGKDYRIWQPFEGNPDFILLQSVGWLCYGLAIFFATLHLNERGHENFLLFLMAFLVLSQFFIHMSVVRFGRNGAAAAKGSALPPTSETAAAACATSGGEDPLTNDRTPSQSPARSGATTSEETSRSQQRSPLRDRSSGETPEALRFLVSTGTADDAQPSFNSDGASPFVSSAFNTDSARGSASSLLLSSIVNGELLLSMVLIGVSLVLRVVVIAAAYIRHFSAEKSSRDGSKAADTTVATDTTLSSTGVSASQVPVAAIIVAATFFSVTATPLVQWSMRCHVRLFHPLSHAYVALATLGWGTYLLLLSRFVVLWGLLGMEKVAVTSPITRVGLSCFLPSSEFSAWLRQSCDAATVDAQGQYTTGAALTLTAAFEGAVEGFVWCFPFLCLLAGNLFQTHAFLREAAAGERVQRAVTAALRLFREQTALGSQSGGPTTATSAFANDHDHDSDAAASTHARRGREVHLTHLLHTIAGSRGAAAVAAAVAEVDNASLAQDGATSGNSNSNSNSNSSVDRANLRAVHDAARYLTIILSFATSAAFLSAAFLANAQPIMTLGFGAVGTVTLGLSCVALHYIYGTRVHSGTRPADASEFSPRVPVYTFFMPFVGGTLFVVLQSVGWISYTCIASLMIACVLEGKGTAAVFVVMAALSVVAQVSLWCSVGCFDESKVLKQGFLQRNAEGFLAAMSVVATVSFCRLYDMAEQGKATAHVVSSMVPVVVCSIAVFLAVPLGLISLQRQAELYGLGSFAAWFAQDDDDDEVDDDGDKDDGEQTEPEAGVAEDAAHASHPPSGALSPWTGVADSSASAYSSGGGSYDVTSPGMSPSIYSCATTENPFSPLLGTPGVVRRRFSGTSAGRRSGSRRRSLVAVVLYLCATVLAMLVIVVLPFALMFMGYAYYTQRATVTYGLAVRAVETLLCCFTALVVLPMLVVPVLGRSSVLRNVHSAFCCWALYNIPTYTVLGGVSTPFIYNCRGTYLFSINMCSMALLSNLPYMPIVMSIFSMCAFVYFVKYHLYDGAHIHKHAFEPAQCVADLAIAVFWLWYQRRYHGRPEITGRLQSRRATRFFQQYFFRGLAYYFSMRVIVGDGYVLPQEEPYVSDPSEVPRVNLNKPENQYIFSFHPHGVFPGTSLVVPKTEIWEKAVGHCEEHFVSTHCADIVFNVPLMREFPMCVGSMSVSRRGIESSLRRGNSPLIVTGGQSEMLLTRMTDYEMHVVCHHIGFIRIAMKNRVPLVPVISFSESNILDNLHCIRLQRWFLNRIAFPFPTLPIGRWYLPLPTTKPVTIVVGQPISPLPGRDNPEDQAHVEELRLRYFEHLEVLFYKYRAEAGYPKMELYLHNGIYNPGVCGTPSVATPLRRGSTQRQNRTDLSVEIFDSAVRRAFAMSPDERSSNLKPLKTPEAGAGATAAAAKQKEDRSTAVRTTTVSKSEDKKMQ